MPGTQEEGVDITPADTNIEPGSTQHSQEFAAGNYDGVPSFAWDLDTGSGSGTVTVKLQASYDGGATWHDVNNNDGSAFTRSELDGIAKEPEDRRHPLMRLAFTEGTGTSGNDLTINDVRAFA